jgi:hypothetical protein
MSGNVFFTILLLVATISTFVTVPWKIISVILIALKKIEIISRLKIRHLLFWTIIFDIIVYLYSSINSAVFGQINSRIIFPLLFVYSYLLLDKKIVTTSQNQKTLFIFFPVMLAICFLIKDNFYGLFTIVFLSMLLALLWAVRCNIFAKCTFSSLIVFITCNQFFSDDNTAYFSILIPWILYAKQFKTAIFVFLFIGTFSDFFAIYMFQLLRDIRGYDSLLASLMAWISISDFNIRSLLLGEGIFSLRTAVNDYYLPRGESGGNRVFLGAIHNLFLETRTYFGIWPFLFTCYLTYKLKIPNLKLLIPMNVFFMALLLMLISASILTPLNFIYVFTVGMCLGGLQNVKET